MLLVANIRFLTLIKFIRIHWCLTWLKRFRLLRMWFFFFLFHPLLLEHLRCAMNTKPKFPFLLLFSFCVDFSGESFDYFMNFFGKCFVRFFTNFGYDRMIKATGRYFCDFLQSVDNIHLQMRFTYPKMKSPSMQLTQTDEHGAVLVYRSGRSGFSRWKKKQFQYRVFFLLNFILIESRSNLQKNN